MPRSAQVFKPEMKAQDFRASDVTTTTTAGRVTLCDIDQDGTFTGRNGNWIQIKELDMNLTLEHTTASTSPGSFVRLIVCQDLQQQADTLSSMTQVLSDNWLSHYNAQNGGRFKIYYDKLVALDHVGSKTWSIKKTFKLDIPVAYNGTAGTNLRKNGLYFFYVGSETTDSPVMNNDFRIKFYDH